MPIRAFERLLSRDAPESCSVVSEPSCPSNYSSAGKEPSGAAEHPVTYPLTSPPYRVLLPPRGEQAGYIDENCGLLSWDGDRECKVMTWADFVSEDAERVEASDVLLGQLAVLENEKALRDEQVSNWTEHQKQRVARAYNKSSDYLRNLQNCDPTSRQYEHCLELETRAAEVHGEGWLQRAKSRVSTAGKKGRTALNKLEEIHHCYLVQNSAPLEVLQRSQVSRQMCLEKVLAVECLQEEMWARAMRLECQLCVLGGTRLREVQAFLVQYRDLATSCVSHLQNVMNVTQKQGEFFAKIQECEDKLVGLGAERWQCVQRRLVEMDTEMSKLLDDDRADLCSVESWDSGLARRAQPSGRNYQTCFDGAVVDHPRFLPLAPRVKPPRVTTGGV